MKKIIVLCSIMLGSQSLAYDSSDIVNRCKYDTNWDGNVCSQAIYAIAHDRSRPAHYRYYSASVLADKFCRRRSWTPKGKEACKLSKYYINKHLQIKERRKVRR